MQVRWGLYCGLMLSLTAFSIDIILPAFPGLSAGLDVSTQKIQLVVPVYLFAMGLAHPFYGALTDRVGRKPGVYFGLSIFIAGTLVCFLATSLSVLLVGRFLQGFGAAASSVICRAMIRDRFSGSELAQNMAIASLFFAIGPVLAPLFGYLIYASVGWRGVFGFLVLFALILSCITYRQPETLPLAQRRDSDWRMVVVDFVAVYQQRQSRYFIFLGIVCSGLIISFLEHAQVLYAELGASSARFALLFALSSVGIVFGQIANLFLIRKLGVVSTAKIGAAIVCATCLCILIAVFNGVLTDRLMTVLMMAFHTSYLILYSNFVSLTLDPHARRAGAAAAAFGFGSYMGGSVLAALITWVANEQLSRWSVCFFVLSAVIAVGVWFWRTPILANKVS